MMSVPYNLNSYSAYLAVGVDTMFLNSTGLFDHLYYYSGPFERASAGSLVEFTPEGGKGMLLCYELMFRSFFLERTTAWLSKCEFLAAAVVDIGSSRNRICPLLSIAQH